jgi:2-oxoglutarate ferredoxin oxidoreductase subunit alpha
LPRTNDFALKLANVNGTGSASANGLLMQAIFRMGIPVSGKNLFPSNIQGLPTWYEIRVNKDGHVARTEHFDLFIAMNAETYAADLAEVQPGGYVLYDSTWPLDPKLAREDVTFLGIPLARLVGEAFTDPRERILMKNIAYVGALVALLAIDLGVVEALLEEKFAGKPKLRASNHRALEIGRRYVVEHIVHPLPFKLAPMAATQDSVLIDGNTAAALGCVYAGATVAAWYPITPATSLMDAFRGFCAQYRKGPDGNRFCIVQAEDELAAVGMTIGAGWAGARAFTSTAGPGISLMNELIGLAYYAEVPIVIFDVQRVGPSTGMPTRTQQGDILACAYASHGDTKHLCLFPADPEECFRFAVQAFDLAERFQTPTFVLSDLDIGMNDWVCRRFTWDDGYRPTRGRVLDAAAVEKLAAPFTRYWPVDEDFVAARTLPGQSEKGAYFARGSGHNKLGGYTETPNDYQEVVDRLAAKHHAAARAMPAPLVDGTGARRGVITVGGCDKAVREGLETLRGRGLELDFMRVRGFPFGAEVAGFIAAHERCFVIEQNRDAQLRGLLVTELGIDPARLVPVLAYGGYPLCARDVVDGIRERT